MKEEQTMPQRVYHPKRRSSGYAYGWFLTSGDVLKKNDRFANMSGRWEICPCPGLTLGKTETLWVRPYIDELFQRGLPIEHQRGVLRD